MTTLLAIFAPTRVLVPTPLLPGGNFFCTAEHRCRLGAALTGLRWTLLTFTAGSIVSTFVQRLPGSALDSTTPTKKSGLDAGGDICGDIVPGAQLLNLIAPAVSAPTPDFSSDDESIYLKYSRTA